MEVLFFKRQNIQRPMVDFWLSRQHTGLALVIDGLYSEQQAYIFNDIIILLTNNQLLAILFNLIF